MITICRDSNLIKASEITKIPWKQLSDEIVRILKPKEDCDEGYNLEQYTEEYYSMEKLLADINVKPSGRVTKAISKLTFCQYEDDNTCAVCGCELVFNGETIVDDEMGVVLHAAVCPLCQRTIFIQK
jgi:hypothetical protein